MSLRLATLRRVLRQRCSAGAPRWLTALAMPAWAGGAVGLVELGGAYRFLPPGATLGLLTSSCLLFGALVGWLAAVPLGGLRLGLGLLWGADRSARPDPLHRPALLLATAAFALLGYDGSRRLQAAELHNRGLGAWLMTSVLLLGLLMAAGGYVALRRALRRLRPRMAGWGLAWTLAVAMWGALLWRLAGALGDVWGALPHRLLWLGGLLFCGGGAMVYADRWLPRPLRWPLVLPALLLPGLAAPYVAARLGAAPTTMAVLLDHTELVGSTLRLVRRSSDRDGDGWAALLGGGDCDDADPAVHPGALERLDDDVDQDCDGIALRDDPTEGSLDGRIRGPSCETDFALPAGTHVVLLVADATRADRLRSSQPRDVLPELRALSRDAVWFARCYTPHPSTAYALPALFTGLQSRWARDLMTSQYADIPPGRPVWQSELAARGYRTAGIYGHFLAGHRHRMTRGMNPVRLRRERKSSQPVADDAIELIEQAHQTERPLFLYAHFNDPHWEYAAYRSELAPWGNREHVDRYDGELRNVDRAIGRIVHALEQRRMLEQTLLVVVADHGQEFGEHGGRFHGQTMYEEVLRVPCLVRVPGVEPRIIRQPVSLIDLFPTVLDLLGLSPTPPVQGVSLEPLALGQPCRRGPIVGEMQPWSERPPFKPWLWYLVAGDDKIIYDVTTHTYQWFDLARDPAERVNRVELEPARFERLRRQLHRQVVARIALPLGSFAAQQLRFPPSPPR